MEHARFSTYAAWFVVLAVVAVLPAEGLQAEAGAEAPSHASTERPRVVETNPVAFAEDVDPSLGKITVTFDRPMMDGSWSWTGGGETFPKIDGEVAYNAARTTCTLPVLLEAGTVYWVGINSPSHGNFKTPAGTAAQRYVILFATRSVDGKPTPLPEKMLQQARAINRASQPADNIGGSKLSFRIAPLKPGLGKPMISKEQLAKHAAMLKAGKVGQWWTKMPAEDQQDPPEYLWLPVHKTVQAPDRIVGEYDGKTYMLVSNKPAEMMVPGTGKDAWGLSKVSVRKDHTNQPSAWFAFDEIGAERFATLTKANINQALAIVVDDTILSVPVIKTEIRAGGWISGTFTPQEAEDLVKALQQGMPPKDGRAEEEEAAVKAAVPVAEAWLAVVDAGKAGEAWDQTAKAMKKSVPRDKWIEAVAAAREPLGTVQSRKRLTTKYTKSIPGAPDGTYVVIYFETVFENKQQAMEIITPMLEADGQWRVSGYYVR